MSDTGVTNQAPLLDKLDLIPLPPPDKIDGSQPVLAFALGMAFVDKLVSQLAQAIHQIRTNAIGTIAWRRIEGQIRRGFGDPAEIAFLYDHLVRSAHFIFADAIEGIRETVGKVFFEDDDDTNNKKAPKLKGLGDHQVFFEDDDDTNNKKAPKLKGLGDHPHLAQYRKDRKPQAEVIALYPESSN